MNAQEIQTISLPGINPETVQSAGLKHVHASAALPLAGTEQPGLIIPNLTIDDLPVMDGQTHFASSVSITHAPNQIQHMTSLSPQVQNEKNQTTSSQNTTFRRQSVHRKNVAEEALVKCGEIDWHDHTTGYLTCPGQHLHNTKNGDLDCQIKVDGIPTVYCLHQSCKSVIDDANRNLRGLMNTYQEPHLLTEDQTSYIPKIHVKESARIKAFGAEILEGVRNQTHEGSVDVLRGTSPVQIPDDNGEQLKLFMSLLPPQDHIWIGNKEDSGQPSYSKNFKTAKDWILEGSPAFPLICTSSFDPGSFSRSKSNVIRQNLFVFECDAVDMVLAQKLASREIPDEADRRRNKEISVTLIRRLQNDLNLKLVAVVDSGNKSLHAYFCYPGDEIFAELKHLLPAMGGDPNVLGKASASRLPGYEDAERKQTLLYFDNTADKSEPKLPSSLLPPSAFERFSEEKPTSLNSFSATGSLMAPLKVTSLNSYSAMSELPQSIKMSSLNSSSAIQVVSETTEVPIRTLLPFNNQKDDHPVPLGEAAYQGIAGMIVRQIEPHTEADPVGMLVTVLTLAGSMAGGDVFIKTGAAKHCLNIYTVIVGATSKGRKGTALAEIKKVFEMVDQKFTSENIKSGLASGEGLIDKIKDEVFSYKTDKATGRSKKVSEHPGINDKRLCVVEGEFAKTLNVMKRDGNTLSATLRDAWDGVPLETMAKNSPTRCAKPHVSIYAQITKDELTQSMKDIESANGFANRFIFIAVKRSKLLPHGGTPSQEVLQKLAYKLDAVLKAAKNLGEISWAKETLPLWEKAYMEMSKAHPGLFGGIIARSEAQVLRLSALYAMLDGSKFIMPIHLEAALELWRYSEESSRLIFGVKIGNTNADKILEALIAVAPECLSRTEISEKVMLKNATAFEIDKALRLLLNNKLVQCFQEKAANGKVTQLFQYAESTNLTNSRTDPPPLVDAAGSSTSNTKADFVEFVDLNVENAIVTGASKLNTPAETHTASSSFLSSPFHSYQCET